MLSPLNSFGESSWPILRSRRRLSHRAGKDGRPQKKKVNSTTRGNKWFPDTLLIQLRASASAHHVTVGTILYGAWALLLQRYSDRDDVLFGVTMAGRPHDLVGAEDMVGLFINTLPLRLWLPEEETVVAWLQSIHEQQAVLRAYEQTPLAQVQEWSELPPQTALFEEFVGVGKLSGRQCPAASGGFELSGR
ncbi:MAG: condensation domain-containing protein [Chloroflexi bacterium]|nr:condensation domain-containing protein [Chloroflexota bacterium]